jgi:hypothetical protein
MKTTGGEAATTIPDGFKEDDSPPEAPDVVESVL